MNDANEAKVFEMHFGGEDREHVQVGIVVRECGEWAAYDMSDFEVYRGPSYSQACEACRGR